MKNLFLNKFLVFLAVICFAFKAFSVGTYVLPAALEKTIISQQLIKINHSNNFTLFQYQNNESSLFDLDNEEIEEDIDAVGDHLAVDIDLNPKPYFYFQVSQITEVHTSNIRKKTFAEATPIFIQFRNFRL